MPEAENQVPETYVGYGTLSKKITKLLIYGGITSYLTFGYTTVHQDIDTSPVVRCLLVYIILSWCTRAVDVANIWIIIRHFGQTYHEKYWGSLQAENSFPFSVMAQAELGLYGLSIYFMTMFTPISPDNCGIFEDQRHGCISAQIITFFGWLHSAILMFVLLVLILICCCYGSIVCCKIYMDPEHQGRHQTIDIRIGGDRYGATGSGTYYQGSEDHNVDAQREILHRFGVLRNVIPVQIPGFSSDQTSCVICMNNFDDTTVGILECGHKFHRICVNQWISGHHNCPMCRREALGKSKPWASLGRRLVNKTK